MQTNPNDPLSPSGEGVYERRFGGLARLYGSAGAQQLRNAHITVVGVGGVGSWAVEALARSGVGVLTLIDMDHVSESNINRQIQAVDATIGQAKIEALRDRIATIHPGCQVHCIDDFLAPENCEQLMHTYPCDALIDACDQVRAKVAMAVWAAQNTTKPFIAVGAAGGKQRPEAMRIADLADATHDPLLSSMRRQLRKAHGFAPAGKRTGISCLYSTETVRTPELACDTGSQTDGSLNCHGYGSSVAVTASFGMAAAGWVLSALAT